MSTLMDELTAIKTVEDKITANKVANFAYTDTAYNDPATYADGVANYDPDAEQNIPVGNPSTLKVNATILTKGWRAQASAITRMLMNHFLGRCSYNLNKINDLFSLLLTKLMAFMGQPDGLATLDSYGRSPDAVGSNKVYITRSLLGAVFGRLLGRTWTQVTGDTAGYTFNSVTYANGLWVAGSNSHGLWWSENGKSWTQVTGDTVSYKFNVITYANGLWVAGSASHGLWWSEDGKSWTQGTGGISYSFYAVTYADGLWVAGSDSHGVWWSEDGKNWTLASSLLQNYTFGRIVYGDGLWLSSVISDRYTLYSSTDGKTWTRVSNSPSSFCYTLAYRNGIWLAGCSDGLWRSYNGEDWVTVMSGTPYAITYANGLWVAGTATSLWWSENGSNWTQSKVAGESTYDYKSVVYKNGLWIAGSTDSHGLAWSEDGKNWAQVAGDTAGYIFYGACCAKGIWVAVSDSHGLWYSSIEDLIADGTIDLGADIPLVN